MKSDSFRSSTLRPSDPQYPQQLARALHRPMAVYERGNHGLLSAARMLAVVGSRRLTSENQGALNKILRPVRNQPVVIISGLARGCDALAHRIALDNRLPTIAVLGSSIAPHEIYPAGNRALAARILEAGGLLLSPFAEGTPVLPHNFPIRNQIIAALAQATLVVSAARKSGALITAQLALEYGKDILVIPGPVTDQLYEGSNRLIQQGAAPVCSADDLAEYFSLSLSASRHTTHSSDVAESAVLKLLAAAPLPPNEISLILKLPAHHVNSILTRLELAGRICRLSDGTLQVI